MKSILIIVLVLIMVFISGYFMSDYINRSSKSIDIELFKLYEVVRTNNWVSASQNLLKMENKWKDEKDSWAILVDHLEIDNINLSISKMKEYIKEKDTVDALAEISSLRLLFEHIPRKDSLTWTNIL